MELREVPLQGRREIQTWFQTPCLAGYEFAVAVTSDEFRQRMANCTTVEEQQLQFFSAFETHVISAAATMNQVGVIAEALGRELDRRWETCCQNIAAKWDVHVRRYGLSMSGHLADSLEPTIREHLQRCLDVSRSSGQRPALLETTGQIGKTAILLYRLTRVSASRIFWPLFLIVSVGHLFNYFVGLWKKNRSVDFIRTAISDRLALLANRVGKEFEDELRLAVTRLHEWQQAAVTTAVRTHAQEAISVFG